MDWGGFEVRPTFAPLSWGQREWSEGREARPFPRKPAGARMMPGFRAHQGRDGEALWWKLSSCVDVARPGSRCMPGGRRGCGTDC